MNTQIWLPLDKWNGRFRGTGGGGWQAGYGGPGLASAIFDGYAAASTDGGHSLVNVDPSYWALSSVGNLNLPNLQDFASVSLSDMTLLGQAVTASFYGKKPSYSYWTGCSTGGRQGFMLAQRYPDLYDGILANAPAVYWDSLLPAFMWPQVTMNQINYHPELCELEAFTQAALDACDKLDGLEDSIIVDNNACQFDPASVVGQSYLCNGTEERTLTSLGAQIMEATWTGPTDSKGKRQWFGVPKDADVQYLAGTTKLANGIIVGSPFAISPEWIKYFIAKDPDFSTDTLAYEQFFEILHRSRDEYAGIMDTGDADLSLYKARGGKLISWQGAADQSIFPNQTVLYYEHVAKQVPEVQDFFRYFQVPGIGHCGVGGPGLRVTNDLDALVDWVEHSVAPDTLKTSNITLGGKANRNVCAWPKLQRYNGGDSDLAKSFYCA